MVTLVVAMMQTTSCDRRLSCRQCLTKNNNDFNLDASQAPLACRWIINNSDPSSSRCTADDNVQIDSFQSMLTDVSRCAQICEVTIFHTRRKRRQTSLFQSFYCFKTNINLLTIQFLINSEKYFSIIIDFSMFFFAVSVVCANFGVHSFPLLFRRLAMRKNVYRVMIGVNGILFHNDVLQSMTRTIENVNKQRLWLPRQRKIFEIFLLSVHFILFFCV
jgi:hypothetical protein